MSLQLAQQHGKAAEYRDTVGRCCQRHTVTGQVITDWYPSIINRHFVHNRCYQGASYSLIRGVGHRRTRRQTLLGAPDNIHDNRSPAPSQSMNWGWIGERLTEGRNLTDQYKTGIKNVCDSGLQSVNLVRAECPPFCSQEAGR